jgi:hypothetical protein
MRTPYRLAATLAKFRISRALPGKKQKLPLQRVLVPSVAEKKVSPSLDDHAKLPASPILWLTGTPDSLSSAGIGKYIQRLRDAGRTIFLETDGTQLRRRIHEFRPDAGLYLTVRLYGPPQVHDLRMQKSGAFALAMEGVQAAHLSGFLTCAHLVVERGSQLHEINQLLELLCAVNFDGMIIVAENDASEIQRETASVARSLIGNAWWSSFSRLVQLWFDAPHAPTAPVSDASVRTDGIVQYTPNKSNASDSRDGAIPAKSSGEAVAQ